MNFCTLTPFLQTTLKLLNQSATLILQFALIGLLVVLERWGKTVF